MENEKLFLALRAGARAIVNNKRLHGAIYCADDLLYPSVSSEELERIADELKRREQDG